MNEIWLGISPLLSNVGFYIAIIVALLFWYILAVIIAHFSFDAGQEAIQASSFGAWMAVFIITLVAVLVGYFFTIIPSVLSSLSVAIAYGFSTLIITALIAFLTTRNA